MNTPTALWRRPAALLTLLGLLLWTGTAGAQSLPAPSPSEECQPALDEPTTPADAPDACDTCGVGMIAAAVTATAPLTVLAALALVVGDQTGVIGRDPLASFGIPLWGCGLGCAGAHLFFAAITTVAFGRDVIRLCGGSLDEAEGPRRDCPAPTPTEESTATPVGGMPF